MTHSLVLRAAYGHAKPQKNTDQYILDTLLGDRPVHVAYDENKIFIHACQMSCLQLWSYPNLLSEATCPVDALHELHSCNITACLNVSGLVLRWYGGTCQAMCIAWRTGLLMLLQLMTSILPAAWDLCPLCWRSLCVVLCRRDCWQVKFFLSTKHDTQLAVFRPEYWILMQLFSKVFCDCLTIKYSPMYGASHCKNLIS